MPSKQEPRLMLLAALMLFIIAIFFLFCRKTQRAAQTVRPRNLKLSQLVDLNLRRTYQSLSQSAHRWRYSDHRRERLNS